MTPDNTSAPPLDLDAITKRARRVYPKRGWDGGEAERALPVVTEDVPALVARVHDLTAKLDATAQAFDELVAQVWRATGETHEPPADVTALLRRVASIAAENARLAPRQRAGQLVFNALAEVDGPFAESIRGGELSPFYRDDVTASALRAWRDSVVAAARREGAEAMREACAEVAAEHEAAARSRRSAFHHDDRGYDIADAAIDECEEVAAAIRALPLPEAPQ